ncbi:hypothetical protein OG21DRAFT_1502477 [Imleria badia]|nr:hypothetical protein OG21DRAFT_1502477 [Imleria badia]
MFTTIALLCLIFLLLALLILRPSSTVVIPVSPPYTHRRVSFVTSSPVPPRWSSPFHKRPPDSPPTPQPDVLASVDQFGRILLSSPASDISPKPSRRLSTPLRLSFASKRRSSTASCTSTLIHLDQVDTCVPSPQSSTSATQSPLQRTRFVNPFNKHPRSRTLSPPITFKSPDTPPSTISSPSSAVSPPERRRTLVNKFKSIFKSIPPEPSPVIPSKPILTTIDTRLRRKPVARTQPYGPPWNAPMPIPDFALPQHSLQKPQTMSLSPRISRKHSVRQCSPAEIPSMSPGQLSPRAFINKLDEKLSLLQQQHIQDSIPSPHG